MKFSLAIIGVLWFGISMAGGPTSPPDEIIVSGRLESGISYYIVKTPRTTVDYFLIQNTGSSLERTGEDGLAHFIEHLSFLSTDHFEGGVGEFCKRHLIENNASTYQDKIIYYASGADASDTALNDSCLYLLYDWCGHLTLNPRQVEQEKRVIMEEWRTRRQPTQLDEQLAAAVHNYTPLGRLGGLGDMERLMSYSNEELQRFCDGWFSPHQAAIMISGAVDLRSVEAKIKKLFSDIKSAPNYLPRTPIVIPDNDSTIFRTVAVSGLAANNILIYSRINTPPAATRDEHLRELIYAKFFNLFVERRLARYREEPACDLTSAKIVYEPFMKNQRRLHIAVVPRRGRDKAALQRVVGIQNDLLNRGLDRGEIADLKGSYNYHFGCDYLSCGYPQIVEANFLRGEPLYTSSEFNAMLTTVVENFDNEAFAAFCRRAVRFENLVCFAYVGDATGKPIDQQTFLDITGDTLQSFGFAPASDFIFDEPLAMSGSVVRQTTRPGGDGELLTLSNGVSVLLRSARDARITLHAVSKGGTAALEFGEINMGRALPVLAAMSGVGENSKQTLDRVRFKHDLNLDLAVEECCETITASAPAASAEVLLQLLYLQLERPAFDMNIIGKRSRLEPLLHEKIEPADQYKTMLQTELYGRDPRNVAFGDSFYNNINIAAIQRVFDAKFRNPAQWFYIIEGDLSQELVVKYLGALTAGGEADVYTQRRAQKLKKSVTREIIYNTPDNNGGTDMSLVYSQPLVENDRADFSVMAALLRNRVNDEFRDQRAAIYGMFTESYVEVLPDHLAVVTLNFGSKKEDQQPLAEFIVSELRRLAEKGLSEEELTAAKMRVDAVKFAHDESVNSLFDCYLQGLSVGDLALAELNLSTIESVRQFTKKFHKRAKIVRFVFK